MKNSLRENIKSIPHKVLDWLESLRENDEPYGTYRMSKSTDATIFASCFAVFVRNLFGDLETLSVTERSEWVEKLKSFQDAKTGLFIDPYIYNRGLTKEHNSTYVSWQLTCFCVSALRALGSTWDYDFKFLRKYTHQGNILDWLERRDWNNPWLVGNEVMFLGKLLIIDYEQTGNKDSQKAFKTILVWHDIHQNPATGFWGKGRNALYFEGLYGAYHQYLLYFYTGHELAYMDKIVDRILSLQQKDGLFSPLMGGGGCEDMDAIDTLVKIYERINYRKEDIKIALGKAYWGLIAMQNDDGGFVWARRKRFGITEWIESFSSILKHNDFYYWYYLNRKAFGGQIRLSAPRHSPGWTKKGIPTQESDVFSTWFRCASIMLICQVLDDVPLKDIRCEFLKTCGLGWHG